MVSKEEFKKFAEKRISATDKKQYVKYEKRKKLLLSIVLPVEILLIIVSILIAKSTFAKIACGMVGIVVFITSLILIIVLNSFKWDNFKAKHFRALMDYLLRDYSYTYNPKAYMHEDIFRKSCFYNKYDDYTGEDLFTISIKNDDGSNSKTQFMISDLDVTIEETKEVTKCDEDGELYTEEETETVPVYEGAFGYVQFPFSFKCVLEMNVDEPKYEQIKLEDIQFNKAYQVSTNDEVEAFYILTPVMINKLKKLNKSMKNVTILLKDNEMFLGFAKNLFELKIGKSKELTAKVFDDLYDDISAIIGIIEEIRTNNKVFKMENPTNNYGNTQTSANNQGETNDTQNSAGGQQDENKPTKQSQPTTKSPAKTTKKRESAKPYERNDNGELGDLDTQNATDSSGKTLVHDLYNETDENN